MENSVKARGLDASVWQGRIDWRQVAASGIKFAILRASIGMEADSNFVTNIRGAQNAGIDCGAYHYTLARSTDEAVSEADFFLNNIKGYKLAYPVALDIESVAQSELSEEEITEIIRAFCTRVQNAGYYAAIYCDLYWIDNLISPEIFNEFDLWLAEWTSHPTYGRGFGMWQYTGDGTVSGISSNVDLDYAYKDYPRIMRSNGLNGYQKEDEVPDGYFLYTVKRGDTLWQLARRFGTTYEAIAELNGISPPYVIDIGQVLKIPENSETVSVSEPVDAVSAFPETEYTEYTVREGDSLWEIGNKYGVDYMAIARLNRLDNSEELSIGQVLKIPVTDNNGENAADYEVYTVKNGDTIWKIAAEYGIDFRELAEYNNLSSPDNLRIGQKIRIPVDTESGKYNVGDRVRILPDAEYYYTGRKIPDWVKSDYTYYITAIDYNGQQVILGGKPSVLLGKRRNNITGAVESGFDTWVNTDILEKINN